MAPKRRKAAKKRKKSTRRRSSSNDGDLGGVMSMNQNGILSQIKPIPGMAIDG